MKLIDFKKNVYSQNGEDGIIEKVFEIIGCKSSMCVEFGAWDGIKFSNTANLWKRKSWYAILIESDLDKYKELVKNTKDYECQAYNMKVDIEGYNSIDTIVHNNAVDLMSIDIDGEDYYIFESMKARPRVILCEYNPTIPTDIWYADKTFGCSIKALVDLAESKGYNFVGATESNGIFVLNEYFSKFKEYETDLSVVPKTNLTHIMTAPNGSFMFSRVPCFVDETQFAFKVIK